MTRFFRQKGGFGVRRALPALWAALYHDVDSLSVEHGLPVSACHWLSTGNHPRAIQPTLQDVRAKIDAFLWENMRAVVVLEGVEYLAGMNGDGPTIDFLRDAVDGVRMDDHVLLTTADLNAFELEPGANDVFRNLDSQTIQMAANLRRVPRSKAFRKLLM